MNPEYMGGGLYGVGGHHGIGHVAPLNPVGKRRTAPASDSPIFDALLAESSPDRRAVVLIGLATAELTADYAWAAFESAMREN